MHLKKKIIYYFFQQKWPYQFLRVSDLANKKWAIGTILRFRCAGSAQLNSKVNYSRCNEDAQWSHPIPGCMDSCVIPKLVNATILDYTLGKKPNNFNHF